jgi:hypothetical protein
MKVFSFLSIFFLSVTLVSAAEGLTDQEISKLEAKDKEEFRVREAESEARFNALKTRYPESKTNEVLSKKLIILEIIKKQGKKLDQTHSQDYKDLAHILDDIGPVNKAIALKDLAESLPQFFKVYSEQEKKKLTSSEQEAFSKSYPLSECDFSMDREFIVCPDAKYKKDGSFLNTSDLSNTKDDFKNSAPRTKSKVNKQ